MAKLKIFTFPEVVLSQKAAPIERVEKDLRKVADDMLETMYYSPGVGLAANQVGLLKRIIVLDTEYELEDPPGEVPVPESMEVADGRLAVFRKPIVMINPEIVYREGKILFSEGCLSVPEYSAEVERSEKVKVRYQDIDGVTRELAAEGLQAVCIQHELDHLEGRLFIDRLSELKRDMVKKKLLKGQGGKTPGSKKL